MDIKFIQFYLLCKYNKSIESYFFVSKSTVSNWRKRGIPIKYLNIKWHLDHIIPISWAKDEDEVIKLNHYKNLQPLWAEDNLLKNNKFSG